MKDFNQKDIDEKFETFDSYTEDDAQKVMDNQEKIEKIASNDTLHKYLADIKLYFQMLGDVFTGKYKKLPVGTIAAIVGTLLYVLSPIDLDGYNKSAVEKYLKLYENKERYFECKGTAENSGKKQFRFQMRLDQRRQRSSWA